MASSHFRSTAVAAAASTVFAISIALVVRPTASAFASGVSAASIAGSGSSCFVDERLTCDADGTTQRRCDCTPTCRYFRSCCESELEAATANSSAVDATGSFNSSRLDGCTTIRSLRGLYECETQRYGDWPTYVIDRCPPNSDLPRQLVRLCDQYLGEKHYYDARFWPVTSNATFLVYQSIYCALCHGESARNLTRWKASLNCPNGTDINNRTQLLGYCKVLFSPPAALDPPRCWPDFVDQCQQPTSSAVAAAIVAAGCGEVASIGQSERSVDPAVAAASSAGSQAFVTAEMAIACYQAPQAVVWHGATSYRNSRCAECSGLNASHLSCSEIKYDRIVQYPGISFRALLDPGDGIGSRFGGGASQMHCSGEEYYNHWNGTCVPLCPSGTLLATDGSGCKSVVTPMSRPSSNESQFTLILPNNYSSVLLSTLDDTNRTSDRLPPLNVSDCLWLNYSLAIAALNSSDRRRSAVLPATLASGRDRSGSGVLYVVPSAAARAAAKLPQDAVALCAHCRWITLSTSIASDVAHHHVLREMIEAWWALGPPVVRVTQLATIACLDPVEAAAYDTGEYNYDDGSCGAALDAIGVTLLIASIACLAVHAIAFFFISSLRNMPGRVVFSQVIALLLAFALFLSRMAAAADATACYALGVVLHYFLMAYFVWTLVLAVEIHGAVRVLKKVYSGSRQFAVYSLVGWLLPLVIVAAAVLTDRHGPPSLRPGYGPPQCWMSSGSSHGFVIFFAGPMLLIVLVDIVLYAAIVVRIAVLSRHTARARRATQQHREKAALCVKLLLSLGVLWSFAVAGAFSGNAIVICVFSNVLNASQGIFLFAIFFCSNSRVAELLHCRELGDRLRSSRLASGSSSLFSSFFSGGTSATAKRSRFGKRALAAYSSSGSSTATASSSRPSDWQPPTAVSEEQQQLRRHGGDDVSEIGATSEALGTARLSP